MLTRYYTSLFYANLRNRLTSRFAETARSTKDRFPRSACNQTTNLDDSEKLSSLFIRTGLHIRRQPEFRTLRCAPLDYRPGSRFFSRKPKMRSTLPEDA